ncbi:nucleoside hydrolase [Galbitalea sp. SE-J8]|uniref:nucleoside hydrolase n=1 Tax=Galbitalea sp. SE-J8 TaxID=3054952 RepID=UPI00259D08D3|nr:nucleoside hydrolase [Galbitalea sp. SE-J8]MDM4761580.1 nucleoside hydrolase [Galbitalea sp. SE-J8]
MGRPLYFDCDTGIDDALALGYLLASDAAGEIELLGVGTVSGNVDATTAARNTLDLMALAGRGAPVAIGAQHPLARPFEGGVPHIHGRNGVGNVELPRAAAEPVDESAAELLVWLSHEYAGALEIVAVGPLTNLALALQLDPTLPSRVAVVTIMGGAAIVPGNVTPVAEANIHNDADAAAAVLEADWPIVLVPLDVTLEHQLDEDHRVRLLESGRPFAEALGRILDLYFGFYVDLYGHRACALHDPLAAALAVGGIRASIAPAIPVVVDATDGPGRGQTICDLRGQRIGPRDHPGAHVRVVLRTDSQLGDHLVDTVLTL